MRRGGDKLRVATNGASIGALDQKLSRPEAADEQWRIDTESILNLFSVNSLRISTLGKGRMAECGLSFHFIATNGLQFCNFAVRFVPDRTFNVGVHFRVLNIFMIIPMFSFSVRVIPDGAKPLDWLAKGEWSGVGGMEEVEVSYYEGVAPIYAIIRDLRAMRLFYDSFGNGR
ncbi:hypothetical protein PIB30_063848 [Stylosanthes scabra]|uniref:Uncharacterized protein n=1 Tax=Stylosanthes scabra TaxID=79078 RepID=A0ABU6XJF5_9FABA|nr:hypothetical protein [Stylosanthes scabra]